MFVAIYLLARFFKNRRQMLLQSLSDRTQQVARDEDAKQGQQSQREFN